MEDEIRVTERNLRLDRFLARHFPGYSRTHWQDLIGRGCVQVNGKACSADLWLGGGETVRVSWPGCVWGDAPFEEWILFEDDEILVLNKPPGLLAHPTGESWIKSPEAALMEPLPNLAGLLHRHRFSSAKDSLPRCGLVHRLDRETSGVMIAAKTKRAQQSLMRAFAGRRVKKIYRAIVWGGMERPVLVDAPVGRAPNRRRIQVTPYGRESSTGFRVLGLGLGVTLVEASPLTGRTHQIRAHLAHLHHPVLGDPEWDKESAAELASRGLPPAPRLMLHAYRLTLAHPATGKEVRFSAPVPKDFREYWRQVRR